MSFAKDELDRLECNRETAIRIALAAGAIEECEFHEGFYTDLDNRSPAFSQANLLFNRGQLSDFRDRDELSDAIQNALAVGAECAICAKIFGPS